MTTGISLVRENTASMQPPRSLWVPFPLGRPLGKPGDAAFQRDVIIAALNLLDCNEGPVLADYPHDAPFVEADNAAACPVSFGNDSFGSDKGDDGSWRSRLSREFRQLQPWYDLARRRRGGRTLVGIADQSPEQNIQILAERLDNGELPTDIKWLKRAIEDIKAYYMEAMTAQPGEYDSRALQTQFWQESTFGAAILVFYRQFQSSDDKRMKLVARILAPREAVGEATGPVGEATGPEGGTKQ